MQFIVDKVPIYMNPRAGVGIKGAEITTDLAYPTHG